MRAPRFPLSFAVALGAHAGVVLALALLPRRAPPPEARPVEELDLDLAIEEPSAPAASVEAPIVPEPAPQRAAVERSRTASAPPESPVASPDDVPEQAPIAPSAAPSSSARTAPLDLGVGTYWRTAARGPTGLVLEDEGATQPAPRSVDRVLRDALEAHDRDVGLGSEGPIVTAAHEAAAPDIAPDVGTAVFEVDSDGAGKTVAVRLVSFGPDRARWQDVARELARLLGSKSVRVPPGSRGVRSRIEIVAERTLPAGEKTESHAGAVPDDIPGGKGQACVGEGAQRRCVAGMPLGVTGTFGDLSNVGARRTRIVHVHVLGETTL